MRASCLLGILAESRRNLYISLAWSSLQLRRWADIWLQQVLTIYRWDPA